MFRSSESICHQQSLSTQLRQRSWSSLSLITLCLVTTAFGCEADEESGEESGGEIQCQAAPTCDFNQVEVERCDSAEDNCEVVSMCGETVFCLESELLCNEIWEGCQPGYVQVEMCDEADESCVTQSICGAQTVFYCELEVMCDALPECGDNQEQVDS